MIGLSYFICIFLMTRRFYWYHNFWPPDFEVWPTVNFGHIFWMVSDKTFIFHMCVPYDKTFLLEPNFFTFWPWSLTYFLKTEHCPYLLNGKWYGFHISYACSLWQDLSIGSFKFWHLDFDLEFWWWWLPLEFAAYGGICVSQHILLPRADKSSQKYHVQTKLAFIYTEQKF
jgi:hypothetical protein